MDIDSICKKLRAASEKLALQTAAQKNTALEAVAISIEENKTRILEANAKDVESKQ